MRGRLARAIALLALVCVAGTASACTSLGGGPAAQLDPSLAPTGDDVFLVSAGNTYGWTASYAPGFVLTDGYTIVSVAKGPIAIVSVRLLATGATADVLGVRIRRLHGDNPVQPYNEEDGYPTKDPVGWSGSEPADGAVLTGPLPGDPDPTAYYELLIGYRVQISGTYSRSGVVISYEYRGRIRTVTIPSMVDFCTPKKATCDHASS